MFPNAMHTARSGSLNSISTPHYCSESHSSNGWSISTTSTLPAFSGQSCSWLGSCRFFLADFKWPCSPKRKSLSERRSTTSGSFLVKHIVDAAVFCCSHSFACHSLVQDCEGMEMCYPRSCSASGGSTKVAARRPIFRNT